MRRCERRRAEGSHTLHSLHVSGCAGSSCTCARRCLAIRRPSICRECTEKPRSTDAKQVTCERKLVRDKSQQHWKCTNDNPPLGTHVSVLRQVMANHLLDARVFRRGLGHHHHSTLRGSALYTLRTRRCAGSRGGGHSRPHGRGCRPR